MDTQLHTLNETEEATLIVGLHAMRATLPELDEQAIWMIQSLLRRLGAFERHQDVTNECKRIFAKQINRDATH